MGAGRPAKPTALKQLQGTEREDRKVKNEMMPSLITHLPSAPKSMTAGAKREWQNVCSELIRLDMLHGVDLGLLAAYCIEMATYHEECKKIKSEGSIIMTGLLKDYPIQNPRNSIKNSALKNAQTLANQFGFTPAARAKISTEPKDEESDFDKMMNSDR